MPHDKHAVLLPKIHQGIHRLKMIAPRPGMDALPFDYIFRGDAVEVPAHQGLPPGIGTGDVSRIKGRSNQEMILKNRLQGRLLRFFRFAGNTQQQDHPAGQE